MLILKVMHETAAVATIDLKNVWTSNYYDTCYKEVLAFAGWIDNL